MIALIEQGNIHQTVDYNIIIIMIHIFTPCNDMLPYLIATVVYKLLIKYSMQIFPLKLYKQC